MIAQSGNLQKLTEEVYAAMTKVKNCQTKLFRDKITESSRTFI